jgi:predicted hotdog family 3-hydroxylacyl-ACP dehydratase
VARAVTGIDPAALLPHAPPARLVERVVSRGADTVVCEAAIPAASPFASDGRAPALVAIEAAAQAAAMLDAETGTDPGPSRSGLLVRLRDVTLSRDELPAGATLVVTVRAAGGTGRLGVFEAEVRLDGEPVLAGTLTTLRDGP